MKGNFTTCKRMFKQATQYITNQWQLFYTKAAVPPPPRVEAEKRYGTGNSYTKLLSLLLNPLRSQRSDKFVQWYHRRLKLTQERANKYGPQIMQEAFEKRQRRARKQFRDYQKSLTNNPCLRY